MIWCVILILFGKHPFYQIYSIVLCFWLKLPRWYQFSLRTIKVNSTNDCSCFLHFLLDFFYISVLRTHAKKHAITHILFYQTEITQHDRSSLDERHAGKSSSLSLCFPMCCWCGRRIVGDGASVKRGTDRFLLNFSSNKWMKNINNLQKKSIAIKFKHLNYI